MKAIKYITSRPFWVNLLAAALLVFLLVFLFLQMLSWITKHGKHLTVPAVIGLKTDDAVKLLEKEGFEVMIVDSIFTDTTTRGIVLKQLPDPNATVKINRTVFLTVNRLVPPMIEMPKLENQSLSFALGLLERNHLVLEDTIFREDFMQGTVLEQLYRGVRIPEKAKVQWGSKITLIVGGGLGTKEIMVPSLLGMRYADARVLLEQEGIAIGALITEGVVTDTANAFVYKQNPSRFDDQKRPRYIKPGQVMDIYLSAVMIAPKDSTDF